MCLAVLAIQAHPDWPLIVLANRDEFHARPARALAPWDQAPDVLGGIDLQAGGTWLGMDRQGRLALLTNVRDPTGQKTGAPSRGDLARHYLLHNHDAQSYLQLLTEQASQFNGFNLVLTDHDNRLWHASNYQTPFAQPVHAGVHGLSNALLNTPWPKTQKVTALVRAHLEQAQAPDSRRLMAIMMDRYTPADVELPSTGLSMARERLLASPFIVSPDYGTRCTTLILRHSSGATWVQEDRFNAHGQRIGRLCWQQAAQGPWCPIDCGDGNLITA
jgi:uncharacterized protein with NRDE domain